MSIRTVMALFTIPGAMPSQARPIPSLSILTPSGLPEVLVYERGHLLERLLGRRRGEIAQ